MNGKPQAFLTKKNGFVSLRVVFNAGKRSYNTHYRIMKEPLGDYLQNPEYNEIRRFVRDFPRDGYSSPSQLAKDIIIALHNMHEEGRLSEFDYSELKWSFKNITGEDFPKPGVSSLTHENSYFHKKVNMSSNSSCALESEFRETVKREEENGFSLIKKTIRRRSYPDKEYIEYFADFSRTSLPWTHVKKVKYTSPETGSVKYLIVSDIHVPYHNSSLLYAILSMCEYENIRGLIINGDLVDFDFISSYERNASQISQNYIEESLHEAACWINLFSERFDRKIYIDGNHDDRLRRNTLGDGIRAFIPSMHPDERMKNVPYNSVAGLFLLPIKGFDCYGYGESFVIGNYQIHHGEETGKSILKDRVYYNSVIGHTHRSEVVYNPVYNDDGSFNVRSKIRCGCLLDLEKAVPTRSAKAKENWVNGFSVLTHFSGGECSVENVVCDRGFFVYRDKIWRFNNGEKE